MMRKNINFFKVGDSLKLLLASTITWTKDKRFRQEVDANLQDSAVGYFSYLNNIFAKQFYFIEKFKKALDIYYTDRTRANLLFDAFETSTIKTKDEFILSMQVYFIPFFNWFEEFVSSDYADYKAYLKKSIDIKENEKSGNPVIVDERSKNVEFNVRSLTDAQLQFLFKKLKINGFIHTNSQLKTFKHIFIQKNIAKSDYIVWIDVDDSKDVNKKTLLQLATGILNCDSETQNLFIVRYFKTYIVGNDEENIERKSLNNSRRDFGKAIPKHNRRNIINDILSEMQKI